MLHRFSFRKIYGFSQYNGSRWRASSLSSLRDEEHPVISDYFNGGFWETGISSASVHACYIGYGTTAWSRQNSTISDPIKTVPGRESSLVFVFKLTVLILKYSRPFLTLWGQLPWGQQWQFCCHSAIIFWTEGKKTDKNVLVACSSWKEVGNILFSSALFWM